MTNTIKQEMFTREQSLQIIFEHCDFDRSIEIIDVRNACKRVTAKDITSLTNVPNVVSSKLDGIAINFDKALSNITNIETWQVGIDYTYCNTGISIPNAFDTVVQIEDVKRDEHGRLRQIIIPEREQNIIKPGEKIALGELMIPAYHLLEPLQLGLLLAGNVTKIPVLSKPKIAILPTGNELIAPGKNHQAGKIIESNGVMIESQIKEMGACPYLYPIIPDDLDKLSDAIGDAVNWADIVILNGGTSKGTDDLSFELLDNLGKVIIPAIALSPGRPTQAAIVSGKPVINTVGPPLGAATIVDWCVRALVQKYLHQPLCMPTFQEAILSEDIAPFRIDTLLRMNVSYEKGRYVATSAKPTSSLVKQIQADAVLLIGEKSDGYKKGDTVLLEMCHPKEWTGYNAKPGQERR